MPKLPQEVKEGLSVEVKSALGSDRQVSGSSPHWVGATASRVQDLPVGSALNTTGMSVGQQDTLPDVMSTMISCLHKLGITQNTSTLEVGCYLYIREIPIEE